MRKGINGLCGVVHEQMGCDVRNGDVFIFINGERKQKCQELAQTDETAPCGRRWHGDVCEAIGGWSLSIAGLRSSI